MKKYKEAQTELEKLAKANLQKLDISTVQKGRLKGKYEFNEWLNGRTGKPKGEPYQAWSAGMYIYAYCCVKEKKAVYFE